MVTSSVAKKNQFEKLSAQFNREKFQELNEEMSFQSYLERAIDNPLLALSAYQRLYDMILLKGVEKIKRYNQTIKKYKFFSEHPSHPIFGLEEYLEQIVKHFKGAAGYYGTEKRILLLCGPVGSSKSTIARALKRGLEEYTQTERGALYSFSWVNLPKELHVAEKSDSPMFDEPLKLIPKEMRSEIETELNNQLAEMSLSDDKEVDKELKDLFKIHINGELNPHDQFFYDELIKQNGGDWGATMEKYVRVRRICLSEARRIGIGTFQPKDEKNQDATELTGDVNFRNLGHYGKDSDPRAFNFDGEFNIANRGVIEFIEMLKLDVAFLYDLLGAAQEQQVKPKKFSQVSIDTVIFGHTNLVEYEKLQKNDTMEAFRDRCIVESVPYLLRWSDEIKVLEQDFNKKKIRQHIAPHTVEIAALFLILTRLKPEKEKNLDPIKKVKLYDGRSLPEFTEDQVKEMKDRNPKEGIDRGLSARYAQNKLSNAIVGNFSYINPFMALNELEKGLKTHAGMKNEEERQFYKDCITLAKNELNEILKTEVRRAIVMDDAAAQTTFLKYVDHLFAYVHEEKIKNDFTDQFEEPDERLMRSIEEKINIPEQNVDDFRRSIAAYLGNLASKPGGKEENWTWNKNPQLAKAIEAKLFEDTKDTINLSALSKVIGVLDKDEQAKLEVIKQRLIENHGYNEQSASDVLHYVGSLFVRGDSEE